MRLFTKDSKQSELSKDPQENPGDKPDKPSAASMRQGLNTNEPGAEALKGASYIYCKEGTLEPSASTLRCQRHMQ